MTNLKSEDNTKKTPTSVKNEDSGLNHPENEDIELSDDRLTDVAGGTGEDNGGGGRGKGGGG